jgi:hypothetical protein
MAAAEEVLPAIIWDKSKAVEKEESDVKIKKNNIKQFRQQF